MSLYPRLKWIFLITALLIAVSRIYLGLHYPSDVLAGTVIGAAAGCLFGIAAVKIDGLLKGIGKR